MTIRTEFFVRTAKDWEGVVAHNPFRKEAARDPGHLVVMFLKDAADKQLGTRGTGRNWNTVLKLASLATG